jgi:hypothetical protein
MSPEISYIYKHLATGKYCPNWIRVIDYLYLFPKIHCQYLYFMEVSWVTFDSELPPPSGNSLMKWKEAESVLKAQLETV